jgi:hypothetical protein
MNNMLYTKTDAGRSAVADRGRSLAPAERQVLVLCDGERDLEDLRELIPEDILTPALALLVHRGLLAAQPSAPKVRLKPVELSEAQRYRQVVTLATSMATDLGFIARISAQLQIEKAQTVSELQGVVELLCKHLSKTPLMALRLNKLRQLAATEINPSL